MNSVAMKLAAWRKSQGWSQAQMASALRLKAKSHVSRLEAGLGVTTDLAIAIDRLSGGAVPVAELRPDLHDVRVTQPEAGA